MLNILHQHCGRMSQPSPSPSSTVFFLVVDGASGRHFDATNERLRAPAVADLPTADALGAIGRIPDNWLWEISIFPAKTSLQTVGMTP
jgi:hypothetical protein